MTKEKGTLPARREVALSGLALFAGALAPAKVAAAETSKPAQASGPVSLAGVSPRLTIHTIDTYHGTPATGLRVDFSAHDGTDYKLVRTITIGPNGRADKDPVLVGETYVPGKYQFLLYVGDYYETRGSKLPSPPFLTKIPVNFQVVNAAERIHLPIQFGPWSYTYSRGS